MQPSLAATVLVVFVAVSTAFASANETPIPWTDNRSLIKRNWLGKTVDDTPEPDITMGTADLIKYYGYPVEVHDVFTEDGYRLRVFRIPNGRQENPSVEGHPVVFLQHGIASSSDVWVDHEPTASVGFVLSDMGFDVWLGNYRGNIYGRHHKHLNPDRDSEFWDFTFDEHAKNDLPAMLRVALEKSGKSELQLVGHSLGTTVSFAMLSTTHEFDTKISMFHALAPYVRGDLCAIGVSKILVRFRHPIVVPLLSGLIMHGEAFPYKYKEKIGALSMESMMIAKMGYAALDGLLDNDEAKESEVSSSEKPMGRQPAGTSFKTVDHILQLTEDHTFTKYDHIRTKTNVENYGSADPPEYNLAEIQVPVTVYYSPGDKTACRKGAEAVMTMLGPGGVHVLHQVGDEDFGHAYFTGRDNSKTTMKIVFDSLIENAG